MSIGGAMFWCYLAGAFACAVLAAWIVQHREQRAAGEATALALCLTSLWGVVAAATGPEATPAAFVETLRNLGWLFLLYRLFAKDGRHATIAGLRAMFVVLAMIELLQPLLLASSAGLELHSEAVATAARVAVMFRLMFATGSLVLVHNLYIGATAGAKPALRWAAAALAVLWICDLNFYTVAYLTDAQPHALGVLRGLAPILAAALLAIARTRTAELRLRPSRAIAFQSLSLLVIGGYLTIMVGAAQSFAWLGDSAPPLAHIGFVFTTAVLALIVLPSGRVRGWIKVTTAKHLFQHRYDYRAEWLRFTQTIGRGDGSSSLEERAVQAVADLTDSPAGLLLVPGDRGELTLAARWQWNTAEVPAEAMGSAARQFFERNGFIVDLDRIRGGHARHGEDAVVPAWLCQDPQAWAMVPLLHFGRLVGTVVLSRPPHPRELDWEDFDLLRVVGRQLASYLAEHAGQQALLDARQFDEFNRRIAFVMHDVKNLASQLTLLSRNAERHGDNPAFRADMMITVRNAADKLNALLAKLSRYGANPVERLGEVDPNAIVKSVAVALGRSHPVKVIEEAPLLRVIGNRETLEQVVCHLVQNGIDASAPDVAVTLAVRAEGLHGAIEVLDAGTGMSPDFVRNKLFKPFVSTKPGGFGIGAFEARELVKAMQGRLDVESREGLGSRFVIRLPQAEAAGLLDKFNKKSGEGVASDGSRKVA